MRNYNVRSGTSSRARVRQFSNVGSCSACSCHADFFLPYLQGSQNYPQGLTLPGFASDLLTRHSILQSSWLRDALSELDPSCDKLTFIGNPPLDQGSRQRLRDDAKPMLRIQAVGTFGSTEVRLDIFGGGTFLMCSESSI